MCRILVRKSDGGADGRKILKWTYKKWDGAMDFRCEGGR